jgi:hypothetical protein
VGTKSHEAILDGLVVSVLAIGYMVCRFKPSQGRKNPQHTFLQRVRKILRHVKEAFEV